MAVIFLDHGRNHDYMMHGQLELLWEITDRRVTWKVRSCNVGFKLALFLFHSDLTQTIDKQWTSRIIDLKLAILGKPSLLECNTALSQNVNTITLGMFCDAKYTHHTFMPIIKRH